MGIFGLYTCIGDKDIITTLFVCSYSNACMYIDFMVDNYVSETTKKKDGKIGRTRGPGNLLQNRVFKLTATIMKSHCHETSKIWLPKQDINNDST